jgi:hypothetical protein
MTDRPAFARRWTRVAAITGFLSMFVYFTAAFGLVPGGFRVVYPYFWTFGPLMVVFAMGQYAFWTNRLGYSVTLDIARVFWILAGFAVTLVGTMQGVAREFFDLFEGMSFPEGTSEAVRMGFRGANSIQSGADLAWDVFIFGAFIAFGLVMIRDRLVWKVMGSLGILIGVLGIAFNFAAWPANPGTAGLVDAGPFAGVWGFALSVLYGLEYRKMSVERSTA